MVSIKSKENNQKYIYYKSWVIYCVFYIIFALFIFNFYANKCVAKMLHVGLYSQISSDLHEINWHSILLKILKSVSFFDDIEKNSTLLVNIIRNDTKKNIQINKITDVLIQCIVENSTKYYVIRMDELNFAYRTLKVFPENNINSYAFSVNVANYLHAEYILYGVIYNNSENLSIELQLILVKTGEILRCISDILPISI